MGSINQAQLEAAADFGTAALQAFDEGGTFPAETAIVSVARMAGSLLLRSLDLPLTSMQPGSAVLSEQADLQGPRLIQLLGAVLQGIGVQLDSSRLSAGQAAAQGQKEPFLRTQQMLEPRFAAIQDNHDLTDGEAADAAAAATAVLIKNCAGVLDPHVGFALAVHGFLEGSKTVPAVAGSS